MRRVTWCLVIALVAAGCRAAAAPVTPPPGDDLSIRRSPTPFTGVTVGDVHALIPDRWEPRVAGPAGGAERGLIASPTARPEAHGRVAEEMAAVWIDGTRVGVPSDYYYLAATGAAVDRLTDTSRCVGTHDIILNHRPSFADGVPNSPGDYVALGEGVCSGSGRQMRFAYFVAAPGYGPVRTLGIPASGLYVVVAVLRDTRRAPAILDRLLNATRFGSASVSDLVEAARASRSA